MTYKIFLICKFSADECLVTREKLNIERILMICSNHSPLAWTLAVARDRWSILLVKQARHVVRVDTWLCETNNQKELA